MAMFIWNPNSKDTGNPLLDPLFRDVAECDKLMTQDDSPFARRCFVRAAFAYIEGFFFSLRQVTFNTLVDRIDPAKMVPIHRLALLLDESPKVDATGNLKVDAARLPSIPSFAFTLRTSAELWSFDASKLFSDNGWRQLKEALDVRHRITHPKEPSELEISDDELKLVRGAIAWMNNAVIKIIEQHAMMKVTPAENLEIVPKGT